MFVNLSKVKYKGRWAPILLSWIADPDPLFILLCDLFPIPILTTLPDPFPIPIPILSFLPDPDPDHDIIYIFN